MDFNRNKLVMIWGTAMLALLSISFVILSAHLHLQNPSSLSKAFKNRDLWTRIIRGGINHYEVPALQYAAQETRHKKGLIEV
jgi:hypothetical protein